MDSNPELNKLIAAIDKVDNLTAKYLLREAYDVAFKIFDHDNNSNRPLALVAMHANEDVSELSPLYNRIRRYHLHNINRVFGLSVTEFLDLPTEINDLLLKIAMDDNKKRGSTADALLDDLHKQIEG